MTITFCIIVKIDLYPIKCLCKLNFEWTQDRSPSTNEMAGSHLRALQMTSNGVPSVGPSTREFALHGTGEDNPSIGCWRTCLPFDSLNVKIFALS